jgi:DinB superfamily
VPTPEITGALSTVLGELIAGAGPEPAWVLNPHDPGLLNSLQKLSAEEASAVPKGGGASIAAHVDHVLYGLRLMNRWVAGDENPWKDADWTASWQRTTVTDDEWRTLREQFGHEARLCRDALSRASTDLPTQALTGAIAILAHLAYHLGAIRQIDRSIRGPSAEQAAS